MSNKETMQQALEALYNMVEDGDRTDKQQAMLAITALHTALEQPEPLGWAVEGCSKMWRGEYAELDAKDEARRIGGTCFAYALYTAPQPRLQEETQCKWPTCQNEEYQNALSEQIKQELVTGRQWVGLTKVQRDDFADAYGSYQAVCAIEQALKERNNG